MWKNVRLLFLKEITGAVRDRRTLILTIFFPLIFYPLILAVMGHFTQAEERRIEAITPTVIIVDRARDETFREHLRATTGFYPFFDFDEEQGLADLKDGLGQVMMTVDKGSGGPGIGLEVTLSYDQTDQVAVMAAGRVRDFLQGYLQEVLRDKLDALGLNYDELSPPLKVNVEDVASSESVGRLILSRLLPYFMILAILTGAMGLGAEITAGEKERGTIAILLVSQLSRTEIVLGKFFTILTVSLVSSILSAVGRVDRGSLLRGRPRPGRERSNLLVEPLLLRVDARRPRPARCYPGCACDDRRDLRPQPEGGEHLPHADLHGDRPCGARLDDRRSLL